MNPPKVSVIIPTYNYGRHVHKAIQSVLDQTYSDFELIVVDDGSTDNTAEAVKRINDERIAYVYQENQGLPSAKNTGIKASSGELLAFLDADDMYHLDKLQAQVNFLEKHPDVGLTYGSGIFFDSSGQQLSLRRAIPVATLPDMVTGYPFAPSDTVMRRDWACRVGLFDESFVLNSEDLDFHLRLALEGCQFAGLDRAITYRQLHTGRVFRNIAGKLETFLRALETAFSDRRCPPEVAALRDVAHANHYQTLGCQALAQGETELGQEYLRETVRLNPSLLDNKASSLLRFFAWFSIRDGGNHEELLRNTFAQLTPEMAWLSEYCDWAVARGYLLRGIRDVIWGRVDQASSHLARARELGAQLDRDFLAGLTAKLLDHKFVFGAEVAEDTLHSVNSHLREIGSRADVRWLYGRYAVNCAFTDYKEGRYNRVPSNAVRAIFYDPSYLANRGVLAMLAGSIVDLVR